MFFSHFTVNIKTFTQCFYAPLEQFEIVGLIVSNTFSFYCITNLFELLIIFTSIYVLEHIDLIYLLSLHVWYFTMFLLLFFITIVSIKINLQFQKLFYNINITYWKLINFYNKSKETTQKKEKLLEFNQIQYISLIMSSSGTQNQIGLDKVGDISWFIFSPNYTFTFYVWASFILTILLICCIYYALKRIALIDFLYSNYYIWKANWRKKLYDVPTRVLFTFCIIFIYIFLFIWGTVLWLSHIHLTELLLDDRPLHYYVFLILVFSVYGHYALAFYTNLTSYILICYILYIYFDLLFIAQREKLGYPLLLKKSVLYKKRGKKKKVKSYFRDKHL